MSISQVNVIISAILWSSVVARLWLDLYRGQINKRWYTVSYWHLILIFAFAVTMATDGMANLLSRVWPHTSFWVSYLCGTLVSSVVTLLVAGMVDDTRYHRLVRLLTAGNIFLLTLAYAGQSLELLHLFINTFPLLMVPIQLILIYQLWRNESHPFLKGRWLLSLLPPMLTPPFCTIHLVALLSPTELALSARHLSFILLCSSMLLVAIPSSVYLYAYDVWQAWHLRKLYKAVAQCDQLNDKIKILTLKNRLLFASPQRYIYQVVIMLLDFKDWAPFSQNEFVLSLFQLLSDVNDHDYEASVQQYYQLSRGFKWKLPEQNKPIWQN